MTNSVSLNMLYKQKEAKLTSFGEQKKAVEEQLGKLNSEATSAQVTFEGRQIALSEAVVTLSNFKIPEVMDEPDRASFTRVDENTGEEVFDEKAYNAENEKYKESVRAHEEAVNKKAELESAVEAKTKEVAGAESDYNDLINTAQNKENELSAIDSDMDMSMSELEDLDEQIKMLEAGGSEGETVDASRGADVSDVTDSETPPTVPTVDVPVQNNKGWEYYAKLELEAEHKGEEGYKPTPAELNAKSKEIMQRNIENGNVGKNGNLQVGTPENPKFVTLQGDIDVSGLQTTEQALVRYNQGQEMLAEEARLKAEEEARLKAEEEARLKAEKEAIERGKKEAEESLKAELANMSKDDVKKMLNAKDMSDEEIDKAIGQILGDINATASVSKEYGQDVGKLTGRLAKQYGAKNAQKILGRICNTAAKSAGKAVPFANAAMAGYGVYKVANGDMSGLYDIADVAVSYIPVVGTAISLIGTENIVNFFDFREDLKRPDAIARYEALAMSL